MRRFIIAAVLGAAAVAPAAEIVVGVAPSVRSPLQEVVAAFQQKNPAVAVKIVNRMAEEAAVPAADGKPVDIYVADEIKAALPLAKKGVAGEPVPYAVGRIVLWARRDAGLDLTKRLDLLAEKEVGMVVMPDPQEDPHGRRAKEALVRHGLWKKIEKKVVSGEDAAGTVCLLLEMKAPVAIIPLSLALSPSLKGAGFYYQIHDEDYEPLEQGFAVMRGSEKKPGVAQFADFLRQRDAQKILRRYGFSMPGILKPAEVKPPVATPPGAGQKVAPR